MIVWMLVLLADFVLEFRLEYLWPCWLFLGTVYTTFHCHGLVMQHAIVLFTFRIITKLGLWLNMNFLVQFFFLIYDILILCSAAFMCISNYIKKKKQQLTSAFLLQAICVVFVCAAFTLDLFCLIFVPLHWLFFAASTYVLLNYMWHTGKPWTLIAISLTLTDICTWKYYELSINIFIYSLTHILTCREGNLYVNCDIMDTLSVHGGLSTVEGPEKPSCKSVPSICCTLVGPDCQF